MEKVNTLQDELGIYQQFNLNYNPFPMAGICAGSTRFPLYTSGLKEQINDFIERTYNESHFAGMLVIGDYGFGKTYILRWIEKEVNEGYSQRNGQSACAIFLENPLTQPRELISALISHFGVSKYLTMLWGLITKEFQDKYESEGSNFIDQFRKRQVGLFDKDLLLELFNQERIMDPMRLISRLTDELWKTRQFSLDKFSEFAYETVIAPIFGNTDFANELARFNPKGFNATFRDWVSLIEFKAMKRNIHVGSEVNLLNSVLEVFRRKGYRRVYLLVDEFEDIHENLRKDQLVLYLRTLRDCIQNSQDIMIPVLALKPAVVDKIEMVYAGFNQRFPKQYWIDLAGLMKEDVSKFIVDILVEARPQKSEEMGILPFTQSGIDEIYRLSGPNPRIILQTCSDLLFRAAKKGIDKIDETFIKEYYITVKPSLRIAMEQVTLKTSIGSRLEELEGEG